VAQEKHDGWRSMASIDEQAQVTGINRKGLAVSLPLPIAQALGGLPRSVTDAERVGDVLHVFDLLEFLGRDLREQHYLVRLEYLERLREELGSAHPSIRVVSTARTAEEKRTLLERVRKEKGEGLVFKRLDAVYHPGRPASGGPQLKYPFRARASVYVVAHTKGKRSVEVAVRDEQGQEVRIGKVTIPANYDIPSVGEIVEVRYLYAYKGGSLFQPNYLGPRNDVDLSACTVKQLKFKSEGQSEPSEEDDA
jgi:bifunctional non-homologous end joining protein LigD